MNDFLLCCLGNTQKQFQYTRHNTGFLIINELISKKNICCDICKNKYFIDCKHLNFLTQHKLNILKPHLGINNSGLVLSNILKKQKFKKIFILYDDATMDFLKLRIKYKFSHYGGHNGIKNIIKYIKYNFIQIKVGIGNYYKFPNNQNINKFVLSKFSNQEIVKLKKFSNNIMFKIILSLQNTQLNQKFNNNYSNI